MVTTPSTADAITGGHMSLGIDHAADFAPSSPVTLLYVRVGDRSSCELDDRVREVVARYQPFVELRTLGPAEVQALTGERPAVSRLLVLRCGEVVGQAMGALLPSRELDRVIRCAVEWVPVQA